MPARKRMLAAATALALTFFGVVGMSSVAMAEEGAPVDETTQVVQSVEAPAAPEVPVTEPEQVAEESAPEPVVEEEAPPAEEIPAPEVTEPVVEESAPVEDTPVVEEDTSAPAPVVEETPEVAKTPVAPQSKKESSDKPKGETDNTNNAAYWEAYFGDGAMCVKDEGGNVVGGAVVLIDSNRPVVALVVKGGSVDYGAGPGNVIYLNPTAGTSYYPPLNNGGQVAGVSHYITCYGEGETEEPEPETATVEATSYCHPDALELVVVEYSVVNPEDGESVTFSLKVDGTEARSVELAPGESLVDQTFNLRIVPGVGKTVEFLINGEVVKTLTRVGADCGEQPEPVVDASVSYEMTPPTCLSDGTVKWTTVHAHPSEALPTEPGTYDVVFIADEGHLFPPLAEDGDPSPTKTVKITIEPQLEGEDCELTGSPEGSLTEICFPDTNTFTVTVGGVVPETQEGSVEYFLSSSKTGELAHWAVAPGETLDEDVELTAEKDGVDLTLYADGELVASLDNAGADCFVTPPTEEPKPEEPKSETPPPAAPAGDDSTPASGLAHTGVDGTGMQNAGLIALALMLVGGLALIGRKVAKGKA